MPGSKAPRPPQELFPETYARAVRQVEIVIHRASSNCGQAATSDSFTGLGRAAALG